MSKQAKVVKYFIKSSPVGEVNMVLKDVLNIVDKEIMESEEIKTALREYFEEHRQHITLPDSRVAVVTAIGRQNPIFETAEEGAEPKLAASFVYYDTKLGVKFSFDPSTMTASVHGEESDFPEQLDENWKAYK